MKKYIFNIALVANQFVNALAAGSPDETLSSRAHRQRAKGNHYWGWTADAIDYLFFWQIGHCESAWLQEVNRRQLHSSFWAAESKTAEALLAYPTHSSESNLNN